MERRSRTSIWLVLLAVMVTITSGMDARPPAPATAAAGRADARLEVDISERRLQVLMGEEVTTSYDVAVGTGDHPTPTGTFRINRIIWNPSWTPPDSEWARGKKPTPPGDPDNPMGRVKIFFSEPDYYIHGTENEASLGTAASHGCLRMRNEEVIELARLLMENGGEARPPSWFRRVVNHLRDTEEVRLSDPITISVRS